MKKNVLATLILAGFALVGCSTVSQPQKVTPDKLCTGTKRPYEIKGITYTPQEHYDYKETGIASWYGPRFHGQPKSCGEIFNMHGISAAHKTLPIPSVVSVTNVNNGKTVKLLVDDRGPFVGDRIIDLSKGAATYLGICNRGLGTVEVECLPEESKAFARFVSQYGRYGRDPDGRSWEAIFRQEFDHAGGISPPRPLRQSKFRAQSHRSHGAVKRKKPQPFRKPFARPIPVSNRPHKPRKPEMSESRVDREIDEFLHETRSFSKRSRSS